MKRLVPISFAFLFMALTSEAFSRPSRPSQIPNGGVFSCANCHVNPAGGGDRNVLDYVNPKLTFFGCAPSENLAYDAWNYRKLAHLTNNQCGRIVAEGSDAMDI